MLTVEKEVRIAQNVSYHAYYYFKSNGERGQQHELGNYTTAVNKQAKDKCLRMGCSPVMVLLFLP